MRSRSLSPSPAKRRSWFLRPHRRHRQSVSLQLEPPLPSPPSPVSDSQPRRRLSISILDHTPARAVHFTIGAVPVPVSPAPSFSLSDDSPPAESLSRSPSPSRSRSPSPVRVVTLPFGPPPPIPPRPSPPPAGVVSSASGDSDEPVAARRSFPHFLLPPLSFHSSSGSMRRSAHRDRAAEAPEPRITRSRARSLEKQQMQARTAPQQSQPPQKLDTPPSPASPLPPPPLPARVSFAAFAAVEKQRENVFQADKEVEAVPVASLAAEMAQARKEEGLGDFTGETQQTPTPLTPQDRSATQLAPSTSSSSSSSSSSQSFHPTRQPPAARRPREEEKEDEESEEEEQRATASSVPLRSEVPKSSSPAAATQSPSPRAPLYAEERKDRPPSISLQQQKDGRDHFSTALPSPPSSPSPLSASSPVPASVSSSSAVFPSIFEKHDFALPSLSESSFSSSLDDKTLAWRLQQEEYDAAAAFYPRNLHTMLAELTFQPAYVRLAMSVSLVVNVLLPLLLLPDMDAVVTLGCNLLALCSLLLLYKQYAFTPQILYSCALLLPSLLLLLDTHVRQASAADIASLLLACIDKPRLLLDRVVLHYCWAWLSTAVQTVCLVGGTLLAVRGS